MSETSRKLAEAHYFFELTRKLFNYQSPEFEFHLNAFINAARNVTWVMQKEFDKEPGFLEWWESHPAKSKPSMRKFVDLRNVSVKERSIKHSIFTIKHDFGPEGLQVVGMKGPTSVKSDPIRFDQPIPNYTYVTVKDDNGERRVKVKLVHDFNVEESYESGTKQVKFDGFINEGTLYLSALDSIVDECESKFGHVQARLT
jgi:hypothetical protein